MKKKNLKIDRFKLLKYIVENGSTFQFIDIKEHLVKMKILEEAKVCVNRGYIIEMIQELENEKLIQSRMSLQRCIDIVKGEKIKPFHEQYIKVKATYEGEKHVREVKYRSQINKLTLIFLGLSIVASVL